MSRNEVKQIDMGNGKKENLKKAFNEITYSTYMSMAYLAFYREGLWDGSENFNAHKESFNQLAKTSGGKVGFEDFFRDFSYLGNNKLGFEHYNESFMLLWMALKEWVYAIGDQADDLYKKDVLPSIVKVRKLQS